jgi:hypothetical protein
MRIANFMSKGAFLAIPIMACCLVGLSACDPVEEFYDDTIQIRVDSEGTVQFVVCEDIDAVGGSAAVAQGVAGRWSDFWLAQGSAIVAAGTVGTFGDSPLGLKASLDTTPHVADGDTISVAIYSDSGNSASGGLFIESVDEIEDMWVASDGSMSATPCTPN